MSIRKKTLMTATALVAPVLLGVVAGETYAATPQVDSYVQSAQRLLQNNDLRGAEIQLRNAVQRAPADGLLRMQLAEVYIRQGNSIAAEAELIVAQQRGVKQERLSLLLAEAMFQNGSYGELLREIPAGKRTAAVESMVRTYRGMAQLAIGDHDAAEAMLADAERLDPKLILAKLGMARLLLVNRDSAGAERKIDEALTLAPHDARALDVKGIALSARGDTGGALNYFNQAVKEDARNTEALLDRANFYLYQGDLDAAEKDVKSVQQIQQNSILANYFEALINARRGDFQNADVSLTKLRGALDRMPEALLLAGIIKFNLNQAELAESYLTRYIGRRNGRPQAYLLLGTLALRRGNTDRAIAMLNQALALTPNSPEANGLLAQAYMARGETGRALTLLDQAVTGNPENINLRTQRALNRFTTGDTGSALAELNEVFKSGTGIVQAGPPLVLAALRSGRLTEAATTAEALVRQDSGNLIYQQLLGTVRVAQRNLPAAEEIFRKIMNRVSDQTVARQNLAQVYLAMNRPADAQKLYQDKLAKDANDIGSMQALANLYVRQKDYDRAVKLLEGAVIAAPPNPTPRLQLISIYETQKKWPEAIKEARALVAAFQGNIVARLALGRVYAEARDLPNSIVAYREGVTAFPDSVLLHANYAMALAAAKDYQAAIMVLNKAIGFDGQNDQLKTSLVDVTYQSRGADAALQTAQSFARLNPRNPIGDILAAEVLDKSGKRAEAIALLEKSNSANAAVPKLLKLAEIYGRNNDLKRPIALLEIWSKDHPRDIAPRMQLAELYLRTRNHSAAQVQLEKLEAEQPDDPRTLNNLAWVYGRTNDPRARKIAERAWEIAPGTPGIADTLGWIIAIEGDAANAVQYLQLAVMGMPNNPDAQYHLASVLSSINKPNDARALLQKALESKDDFESKADAKQLLDRLTSGNK